LPFEERSRKKQGAQKIAQFVGKSFTVEWVADYFDAARVHVVPGVFRRLAKRPSFVCGTAMYVNARYFDLAAVQALSFLRRGVQPRGCLRLATLPQTLLEMLYRSF